MEDKPLAKNRATRLGRLFWDMLYISSFTFGGGFVIMSLMKKRFVDQLHWIDEQEMLDMMALAQTAPGAIAVNAAILVGWQVEGLAGMAAAVLGTILPPMVVLSVVSLFYEAFSSNLYVSLFLGGMQAGVAAVILDVVCGLGRDVLKQRSPALLLLMAAAFVANYILKINVVFVILAAVVLAVFSAVLQQKRSGAL